jgi:hypothetical protein
MNRHQLILSVIIISGLLASVACRELYEPEVTDIDHQFLVVEGFLEVGGSNTSEIKVGRTMPIYFNEPNRPEVNATVLIEGSSSGTWVMRPSQPGTYILDDFLPENQRYQVRIQTNRGEYLSEEITPIATPEDLELGFTSRPGYVSIYASTTGNASAKYFIWEFKEDWEFRSPFQNYYFFDIASNSVMTTPFNQIVERCYLNYESSTIILESSERFQNRRISRREIQRIDTLSEKLGERYSILVKQRGLDRGAFEFWDAMRKNSDEIGGIFSPMPSIIGTNIRNVSNPNEPVIGYISAGKTVEKRMYIDKRDLSGWTTRIEDYRFCSLDTVTPLDYQDMYVIAGLVPVIPICEGAVCVTYLAAPASCTDCRQRGNQFPPDFWESYDYTTP